MRETPAHEREGSSHRRTRWLAFCEARIDRLFEGSVDPRIYAVMRIGLSAIFLVRHSDWLKPWVYLEHHRFVRGLMFLDSTARPPALHSPIIPGLAWNDATTHALVYLRTAFAILLLLGIRARLSAALLFITSYSVFAADRFRYYHHLQLLYVSIAWLALAPSGQRFSLEGWLLRRSRGGVPTANTPVAPSPLWPLQLLRALTISVYLAAGFSKLDLSWLHGDALDRLEQCDILSGALWRLMRDALGYAGVAVAACFTELALPVALLLRPTRRVGVALGIAFHAVISASMPVYSFGAQMIVLLFSFWPQTKARESRPSA